MGDYLCNYCQDGGDCRTCSMDFEPDTVHTCGWTWRDHTNNKRGNRRPDIFMRGDCPPRRRKVPELKLMEWP